MRTGTAAYVNGQETVRRILEASRRVLVESGQVNLTMRRVAKETGISLGNLNYYHPSRAELVADLLQHVIDGCPHNFDMLMANAVFPVDNAVAARSGPWTAPKAAAPCIRLPSLTPAPVFWFGRRRQRRTTIWRNSTTSSPMAY